MLLFKLTNIAQLSTSEQLVTNFTAYHGSSVLIRIITKAATARVGPLTKDTACDSMAIQLR